MRVYANQSAVVRIGGGLPVAIKEGQPFENDDDVVREHPWLFSAPVETATAVPGERRNVRKP